MKHCLIFLFGAACASAWWGAAMFDSQIKQEQPGGLYWVAAILSFGALGWAIAHAIQSEQGGGK